jgi:ketosteroid isomerase-like protein
MSRSALCLALALGLPAVVPAQSGGSRQAQGQAAVDAAAAQARELPTLGIQLGAAAAQSGRALPPARPAAAVDELLAADRAFAADAAKRGLAGLTAMFDREVIMPLPNGTMARGKAAAEAALRASPANLTGRPSWSPVRGGISADGRHGFTFGYMTVATPGAPERLMKYMSYWVKGAEGWRVAAFKRSPRPDGELTAPLPPSLPPQIDASTPTAAVRDDDKASLAAAERAFSDQARLIGLGAAFAKFGSEDAANMGRGAAFTLGPKSIGAEIDAGAPPALSWASDGVTVAGSGDLGVSWGMIRMEAGAYPERATGIIPFFTVWRRPSRSEPWRYIAE